jgi:hypothetical protein
VRVAVVKAAARAAAARVVAARVVVKVAARGEARVAVMAAAVAQVGPRGEYKSTAALCQQLGTQQYSPEHGVARAVASEMVDKAMEDCRRSLA